MILKNLEYREAKELTLPSFQREQSNSHINNLVSFYRESGRFASMPILISSRNEVIDGGHRLKAYLISIEKGYITNSLMVLVDINADKNTFLNVNKGKAVSISHKLKLNEMMEKLSIIYPLSSKTSSQSISYIDFGKGLIARTEGSKNNKLTKPYLNSIEDLLDTYKTEIDRLRSDFKTIYFIKEAYMNSCKRNNKNFIQKLFQYFCFIDGKIGISEEKIEDIVSRFPKSLGGDLTYSENLIQFIDIYNFRKRKDKITLDTFLKGNK